MNKLTKVISGVWVFCFFSLPAISQNVAVIDTQAAILQTQVAQDAFKALEEETEYSSMVEEAKELQAKRQNMVEKLHFTPKKRPENTNIRINNISNGKAQIYKNGIWKTVMKHELIYDLITECANRLIDTYELYVEEGKIKLSLDEFEL